MDREQMATLWTGMKSQLNEKQRRLYAGTLTTLYGYGGLKVVHEITGMSENTIRIGVREQINGTAVPKGRVRRSGGGAKPTKEKQPNIKEIISEIIDGSTYGNPEQVLSYTTESLRKLAEILEEKYEVKLSHMTIGHILEEMKYSKQSNQKMLQVGEPHPDRNAQFEYINKKSKEFIEAGEPVISVDTKKKENIGNFKNNGSEYRKFKDPRKVWDHDFPIAELGKIAPYGVYTLNHNTGFVNVGTSHDTAEFAVESISRWWQSVGQFTFPKAKKLLINCDGGGSNSSRSKMWKYQLAQFSGRVGLEVHVSHFPPGTSKWNKIEHRLFCYISKHWQGQPLIDVQTAIDLIGSTSTKEGLHVICQRDDTIYELAQVVSDEQFKSILLTKLGEHGEWNYMIKSA
jgi:hypothetical protein